ncbi:MAG: cyclodeaminase/cyclohydrolase family protein [Bacillota bacterium]
MGKLMDMTVAGFINETASSSPAPGGGSVSALASAMGASLVSMVGRLTAGRKNRTEEEDRPVNDMIERAGALQKSLESAVDEDTAAFHEVMRAYRLPAPDGEAKALKRRAIDDALLNAARVPLGVMEYSVKVLEMAIFAVREGNPNALSDAGVAALMAEAGLKGAYYNVMINLQGLSDRAAGEEALKKAGDILAAGEKAAEEIAAVMKRRLEF